MTRITQNGRIALFSLWSLNQKEARRRTLNFPLKKQTKKKRGESLEISKYNQIQFHKFGLKISLVFHLMFESIEIFCFLKKFWNSVPYSRSYTRQTTLSGTGFSKRMAQREVTISHIYSYVFCLSESVIYIGWPFI